MALTNKTAIEVNIAGFYDRNLLERAIPEELYGLYGQIRPLPKNTGDMITFRRYGSLVPATTPLVEGETPAGSVLSSTEIEAVMLQYGDFVTITDQLIDQGLDPILMEAGDILGEQAGLTIDTVRRDVLVTGTQVLYGSAAVSQATIIAALTSYDISVAVRMLERANAKKVKKQVNAGVKISTTPLRAAFMGITHVDLRADIEALTGYVPVQEYSQQGDVHKSEIGESQGVRFLLTTNAPVVEDGGGTAVTNGLIYTTANTACDVYQTLIFAANAYGLIPMQKHSIENIVKKAEKTGTSDPLNQRSTSGWKAYTTTVILNDTFMVRVETGATELSVI